MRFANTPHVVYTFYSNACLLHFLNGMGADTSRYPVEYDNMAVLQETEPDRWLTYEEGLAATAYKTVDYAVGQGQTTHDALDALRKILETKGITLYKHQETGKWYMGKIRIIQQPSHNNYIALVLLNPVMWRRAKDTQTCLCYAFYNKF